MLVRMHALTCTRVLCMHYNGLLDVCMYAYADVHRGCLDLYIDIWQFKNVWIMTLLYGSHNGVVNTLRKLIRILRDLHIACLVSFYQYHIVESWDRCSRVYLITTHHTSLMLLNNNNNKWVT